jgi:hypothetical protein
MPADVQHAWRAIRAMPVVSIVVVASLGVGIGVNTAVFSWVQAVVLRPLAGVAGASTFRQIEPRADTGSYPGVSWREYMVTPGYFKTMGIPLEKGADFVDLANPPRRHRSS